MKIEKQSNDVFKLTLKIAFRRFFLTKIQHFF